MIISYRQGLLRNGTRIQELLLLAGSLGVMFIKVELGLSAVSYCLR